jgi:hypothetical protein
MPTLIRLIVILLVLVGIGYGAMFALVAFVSPRDKDVTIRIPARDLLPQTERDPLVRREIDTTRSPTPTPAPAAPAATEPAAAEPAPAAGEPAGEDGPVRTLAPGVE